MLIVYCDVCGLRILPKDVESGGAVQIDENKYLCVKCAPQAAKRPTGAAPTMPTTVMIAPTRVSGEFRGAKTTARVPRISGASPASSSSAARRAVGEAEPAQPRNLMLPIVAGSVGVAVLAIGIFVAVSKGNGEAAVAKSEPEKSASLTVQPQKQAQSDQQSQPAGKLPANETRDKTLPSWMQNDRQNKESKTDLAEKKPAAGGDENPQRSISVPEKTITPLAEAVTIKGDETIWFDDGPPVGAALLGTLKTDPWRWVESPAFSGTYSHTTAGPVSGIVQHLFQSCSQPLKPAAVDTLFAYVYLDPKTPPKEIMLQFLIGGKWEHRAYWGDDLIPWGQNFSPSRLPMGPLPKTGDWVRLEIPAAQIAYDEKIPIDGCAFTTFDGVAYWDKSGFKKVSKDVAGAEPPKTPTPPQSKEPTKLVPQTDTPLVSNNKREDKNFPPVLSEEQRTRMATYDKALEALAKKDADAVARLEAVLKTIKVPAAANVFAAQEQKESGVTDILLVGAVERAIELHKTAMENFRKKPPADPVPVEKLKTTGTISRVEGSKVLVKAGGIEMSVDLASIPQNVIYKALALDESKPAGQADKAAWLLGLGQIDEAQQVIKKVKAENRPPWAACFEEYSTLERASKFEAQTNQAYQFILHGKPDTAQVMLNNLKKDYPDLIEANKDRVAHLAKKLEGQIKK